MQIVKCKICERDVSESHIIKNGVCYLCAPIKDVNDKIEKDFYMALCPKEMKEMIKRDMNNRKCCRCPF